MPQTQGWTNGMPEVLERLRPAVRREPKDKLTALYHHVYHIDHLREAYFSLEQEAAAGVDGVTWQQYGVELETNLHDLAQRLRRGAYRATPVRRVYIPKPDGCQRPLGIPALEDKLVQWVTAQLCTTVWEAEFLGFSYGFRPRRNPHNALDALTGGIQRKHVNWVLDADIRAFFDTLSHAWLVKFIEHRIGDTRIVGLIQQWLKAGVLDNGIRTLSEDLHAPIPEQGTWLRMVLLGHYRYYEVPMNGPALRAVRNQVIRLWRQTLKRRSQKRRITRQGMDRLVHRWLPTPRSYHPYPSQRLNVRT